MPQPPIRKRGRPKVTPDDAQKSLILRKAAELFVKKGYGRTTTDEVAAGCRVSKQTLYRLFSGKLELFTAVVDSHRQTMLDLPGDYDDLPLQDALERIFRSDIEPEMDRARMAFARSVTIEAAQFPEIRDVFNRHGRDRSRAELAEWLERQRERGRIEIDDPECGAHMLMDMILGAIIHREPDDVEWPGGGRQCDYIRRCIKVFLNGVRPRGNV
ncbi:TetR/AcrR family transcriptional regulator [Telmatospirillum siberiense]|uniref:TetR/AcrR family transcriptional regulator n=2 Tax=Telmatospirillum siberiense TaxID=382514 RepID=A0A2N3Q0U3_9PROT|nr:TetR/AcrR family transcriptional regulator [Telmatospirillum siberiense]